MNWRDEPIPNDDQGRPMFKGNLELTNDKNEILGSIVWFFDEGPFYAHAVDPNDTTIVRRIGPCTTLEGAKRRVCDALEGKIANLSNRAGYER